MANGWGWLLRPRTWSIVALWLVTVLPGLGLRDMWFPDEPDVAQPVVEMLTTGDWITPRHNGVPWVDYPAVYWMAASAVRAWGEIHPFPLRLPSAVAALLLGIAVFRLGAPQIGRGPAWWAAVMLMLFPHFAWQSINVHPDMVFSAAQGGGLLLYLCGALAADERRGLWMKGAAFALFGVAWLAKGPLGLLLPGLIMTLWHLSQGNWRAVLRLAPLSLVAIGVAGWWYALLATQHGVDWVWGQVNGQNFERFADPTRGHAQPWFYYLERIWLDLGPFSLALPAALLWRLKRTWQDPKARFLWLWAVVPLVFLSAAATKREVYLMPAYPAYALLIAKLLAEDPNASRATTRGSRRAAGAVFVLVGAVFVLAIPGLLVLRRFVEDDVWAISKSVALAFPILAAAALWAGRTCSRPLRPETAAPWWVPIVGFSIVALVAVQLIALPAIDQRKSYRPITTWLDATTPADVPIALLGPDWTRRKRAGFLNYLYDGRGLVILGGLEDAAQYWAHHPSGVVVTGKREAHDLADLEPGLAEVSRTWDVGSRTYVILEQPSASRAPPPPA